MKTSTEIRKEQLRLAESEIGGRSNLCVKLGKSEKQISALIGKNPTRGIGDAMAREMEKLLGYERGWLDSLQEDRRCANLSKEAVDLAEAIETLPSERRSALRALTYPIPDTKVK